MAPDPSDASEHYKIKTSKQPKKKYQIARYVQRQRYIDILSNHRKDLMGGNILVHG